MFRTFMMLYFMLKHVIRMKKTSVLISYQILRKHHKKALPTETKKNWFLLFSIKFVRRKDVSQKSKWRSFLGGKNELFFIILDNLNTEKVNYLVKYRITRDAKKSNFLYKCINPVRKFLLCMHE